DNRVVTRTIVSPLALLAVAAFASTNAPAATWGYDYGLGGLLGDAVAMSVVGLLPFELPLALLTASVTTLAVALVAGGFALGVTWPEASAFLRFLRDGSVLVYAALLRLTGRAATTAAQGAVAGARQAAHLAERARAAREETAAARAPEPEARPAGEGLMARIAGSVRAREAGPVRPPVIRAEPPVTGDDTAAPVGRTLVAPRLTLEPEDDGEVLIEPEPAPLPKPRP